MLRCGSTFASRTQRFVTSRFCTRSNFSSFEIDAFLLQIFKHQVKLLCPSAIVLLISNFFISSFLSNWVSNISRDVFDHTADGWAPPYFILILTLIVATAKVYLLFSDFNIFGVEFFIGSPGLEKYSVRTFVLFIYLFIIV